MIMEFLSESQSNCEVKINSNFFVYRKFDFQEKIERRFSMRRNLSKYSLKPKF